MDTSFSRCDSEGIALPIGKTTWTMEGEYNISCEVVRLYGGHAEMGYFKSEEVL